MASRWRLSSRDETDEMLRNGDVEARIYAAYVMWAKAVRLGVILGAGFVGLIVVVAVLTGGLR